MLKLGWFFVVWVAGLLVLIKLLYPIVISIVTMPNLAAMFVAIIACIWTLASMGVAMR